MILMYRYVDMDYSIHIEQFIVEKKTPKGQWVIPYGLNFYGEDIKKAHRKFVLDDARKKLCYSTLEEAWNSYRIRKRWHQSRLEHKLKCVKAFSEFAENNEPPQKLVTDFPGLRGLFYEI